MAVTTLDARTALLVIDLQQGVVAWPMADPISPVLARACALLEAFRRHRLPVVLVNVNGAAKGRVEQPRSGALAPDWADLLPELNRQPSDHTVTKRTWGAFSNTGLEHHLQQAGITQVVLVGIATSVGVESTARQAQECGFNVTLAVDAMTDRDADAHHNSVTRIFPRLGETGTTEEILQLLNQLP